MEEQLKFDFEQPNKSVKIVPMDIHGVKLFAVEFRGATLAYCDTYEDAQTYLFGDKADIKYNGIDI